MYVRRLKRKCSVRGCKNTDTFAISRTREIGNTVIICKSCIGKALGAIDEVNPVTKTNAPVKETVIPPLFFNGALKKEARDDRELKDAQADEKSTAKEEQSKEEPSFTCPVCGKVCKSESGLSKHMATHKDDEE